ncbi:hypothetical protein D3C80_904110 [compost metagenome]
MVRHGLRRFGGAVEIHTAGVGRNRAHLLVQRRAECIAAPEQVAQALEHLPVHARAGFDELAQGRGQVDDRQAVVVYPGGQARRVGQGGLGRADDRCADRQRREHVPVDRVVAQAREQGKTVASGKTLLLHMPVDEMHQGRVVGDDALRFASAA